MRTTAAFIEKCNLVFRVEEAEEFGELLSGGKEKVPWAQVKRQKKKTPER